MDVSKLCNNGEIVSQCSKCLFSSDAFRGAFFVLLKLRNYDAQCFIFPKTLHSFNFRTNYYFGFKFGMT